MSKLTNRPAPSINEQFKTYAVGDNLKVEVIPNCKFVYLMTTNEVAKGYDVARNTISWHASQNGDEFKEGVHFVKGVSITDTLPTAQPHQVFWTKRGVIRLGMFVKSERAKLFRDWAENVINDELSTPEPSNNILPPTPKKKHNRLTPERLLDIMHYVNKIPDMQVEGMNLREIISNKIMGKEVQNG